MYLRKPAEQGEFMFLGEKNYSQQGACIVPLD